MFITMLPCLLPSSCHWTRTIICIYAPKPSQYASKHIIFSIHALAFRGYLSSRSSNRNPVRFSHLTLASSITNQNQLFDLVILKCLAVYSENYWPLVVLSGLVVSVFTTGSKVCGFKPGRQRCILRAVKVRSTPSFGGEVKPSAPYRKNLRLVKPSKK
jgi:hypothetical protein